MTNSLHRIVILVISVGLLHVSLARAQDGSEKPLLSKEIESVLAEDGAEAAQQRFDEIFPAQKDQYVIDLEAITQLGGQYMQSGDAQSGMLFIYMIGAITSESITSNDVFAAFDDSSMQAAPEQESAAEAIEPVPREQPDAGPARGDLERFHGFYGTPELADERRMLFVSESCNGYLVAGAIWGDAQNWWMKSVGDKVFTHTSPYLNLRMEFEIGSDGDVESMIHDLDFVPSPLPKHGPLPEDWQECVRPEGG